MRFEEQGADPQGLGHEAPGIALALIALREATAILVQEPNQSVLQFMDGGGRGRCLLTARFESAGS